MAAIVFATSTAYCHPPDREILGSLPWACDRKALNLLVAIAASDKPWVIT